MRHPIAIWREKNKLTQAETAARFETAPAVISQIETGVRGVGKVLGRKIDSATSGELAYADLVLFEWPKKAA